MVVKAPFSMDGATALRLRTLPDEVTACPGLATEAPQRRRYPELGEALVGACFVDQSRIEFCAFGDCE